jgi:hypothetical protein
MKKDKKHRDDKNTGGEQGVLGLREKVAKSGERTPLAAGGSALTGGAAARATAASH